MCTLDSSQYWSRKRRRYSCRACRQLSAGDRWHHPCSQKHLATVSCLQRGSGLRGLTDHIILQEKWEKPVYCAVARPALGSSGNHSATTESAWLSCLPVSVFRTLHSGTDRSAPAARALPSKIASSTCLTFALFQLQRSRRPRGPRLACPTCDASARFAKGTAGHRCSTILIVKCAPISVCDSVTQQPCARGSSPV